MDSVSNGRINRNMGCIEMSCTDCIRTGIYRLIETWDVLKLCTRLLAQPVSTGLIETWDVLKFYMSNDWDLGTR